MTDITIDAGTLTASVQDRIVTGLLLPFGEECRSNLGRFTFDAGTVSIPSDLSGMSFNVEHARENVIGHPVTLTETAAGVVASFSIAKTPEGDSALADIASGKRKHLSAEVANVVIKAGKGIAGKLFAAALVAEPAFPSATLLAAEDTDVPDDSPQPLEPVEGDVAISVTEIPETVTVTTPDSTTATFTPKETEPPVGLPNTLNASHSGSTSALSLKEVGELLFAARHGKIGSAELAERMSGENGDTLFGALSDVKYNGTGGLAPTMSLIPQWLGEVKALSVYKQLVLPLFNHADLTSLALSGYKWTQKPDGGDWAGNKAAVPSNTLTVAAVTGTASPWAVGHDIAREFIDFPVEGFFEAYAVAVLESYQRWADAKVATAVVSGATTLAADALATIPGSPAATTTSIGGTIGTTASAIIDGAAVLVTAGILPDFALIAPALWKQMAKIPKNNVLGYLNASLGLDEGSLDKFVLRPSAAVGAGKVLVGAKGAATVYELPGAPIRMDALDIARGGVDKAAFGYAGVVINDPTALQLVTAATA